MTILTSLLTSGQTNVNRGTVGTGVTLVGDYGDGYSHTTVLSISTTLPAIAGGAALGVGRLIYTFPAGGIITRGAYMSVAITQTQAHINANTPDVGLGTVIASGVNALLSDVGATSEDLLTGQTAANCTGTATAVLVSTSVVIAAAGAHTVYLNAAASWAASGDAAALLVGTVILNWNFFA